MAPLASLIPPSWRDVLAPAVAAPSFREVERFVAEERAKGPVFPAEEHVFEALRLTPFDRVKVVLLGQDPYHDDGQAHGLCFSVQDGVKPPPSLANMFKELRDDLGIPIPKTGCLEPWAKQGVLLLNTVLSVRAHAANSHQGMGWEAFTDEVVKAVNARPEPVVFVLWGAKAQKKRALVDESRHAVVAGPHPSPLSAWQGFFGSKPFSKVNAELARLGREPIDWRL